MSSSERSRTLAELARDDAPLPVRRAASVLVAVAHHVGGQTDLRSVVAGAPPGFVSSQISLGADGSVHIDESDRTAGPVSGEGVSAGASIGRLLFELLVGRPPLGRADAVEPFLTSSLPPDVVALLARSCSDAPGQWPEVSDWESALAALAGGQVMPATPREHAARVRRSVWVSVALAVLAAISVVVLLLAPRWWDSATRDEEGLSSLTAAHDLDRS